jgi:hypothetical protein
MRAALAILRIVISMTAIARVPILRTTWDGTVLGPSPNLPWRVILIGAGNNVDAGIIRCDNRVIFFKTDVADNNGTLVTTGTLLPTRTATPTNCDLTFLTVDGDFSITGSATEVFADKWHSAKSNGRC